MRLAVIGATGRTGRYVVEEGLARGHDVTAVVRSPATAGVLPAACTTAQADVCDAGALKHAVAGAEAVISALGTRSSRSATTVYSDGVTAMLDAMRANGISRLVVISAAPVGPRGEQSLLERRLAMPILERFFGGLYADMRRMEAILQESAAQWTSLRPPRLLEKPALGEYRIDTQPLPTARTLTHADLATALLDCLDRENLMRRSAYVAN